MTDIERGVAEALRKAGFNDDPVDTIEMQARALLYTEPMQAIARVVDAAVEWHEGKPSIPSPAFILDHAVTAMLSETCSCGEPCELKAPTDD